MKFKAGHIIAIIIAVITTSGSIIAMRQNPTPLLPIINIFFPKPVVSIAPTPTSAPTLTPIPTIPSTSPQQLLNIIETAQRINVRESWGELAYQCFTDADLNVFIKNNKPEAIAEQVARTREFIEVVMSIKHLSQNESENLLNSSTKPLRQTWAQIGMISREGQTEAGQQAEIIIAQAIVQKTKTLLNKSEIDLQQMYTQ